MLDKAHAWLYHNAEPITGFITSSLVTPAVMMSYVTTAINALIIALISGTIGSIVAHYTKKLITKLENKNGKEV